MTTFFARFDGVTQMLEGLCVSASLTSTTPKTIFVHPAYTSEIYYQQRIYQRDFLLAGDCLTFLRLTIATHSNNTVYMDQQ